jgi:hypothetical protein
VGHGAVGTGAWQTGDERGEWLGELKSADSLAWSYAARRRPPLAGCRHRTRANCPRYALAWRARLLARLDGPRQLRLGDHAA